MNFILTPPLEHIALVQTIVTLFNQHDVRDLVRKFTNSLSISELNSFSTPQYYSERQEQWKEIEDGVRNKIPELTIPTSLKEKLLGYIQPMGMQILRWIEYHFRFCGFELCPVNDLCWTPHGILDKQKTAEALIKDEAIDITTRYKLACTYCLEDIIPELWYKLSESQKISLFESGSFDTNFEKVLLLFWRQYIREKRPSKDSMFRRFKPISFYDTHMLQRAAEAGNKAATKYFFQKLTERNRSLDEVLLKTAIYVAKKRNESVLYYSKRPREYCSEVFCFLLTQINDEQQIELFKKYPAQALQCLIDWPWQNLFVETENHLFSFLPGSYDIFKIIIHKADIDFKDYDYQNMFRDIWRQMPHAQKSRIMDDDNFLIVLNLLLQIKDKESIQFIFQDITLTERKKFIFSDLGQHFYEDVIYREGWDIVKFCIPLCTSSKDEMVKFKMEFQKNIQRKEMEADMFAEFIFRKNRNKVEKFFEILNDLVCGYGKIKAVDDGESNPAKKLDNIEIKE